jgi:hypothetical protein
VSTFEIPKVWLNHIDNFKFDHCKMCGIELYGHLHSYIHSEECKDKWERESGATGV